MIFSSDVSCTTPEHDILVDERPQGADRCLLQAGRMKISHDEVRYVAQLARLRLEEHQIHEMSETLSKILAYMDILNKVDTSDVSPTSHVVEMETAFREDRAKASLPQDDALQNAPDRAGAFYRVPKIIE